MEPKTKINAVSFGVKSKTAPAGNRGLTRSLDATEEGLMAHTMPRTPATEQAAF